MTTESLKNSPPGNDPVPNGSNFVVFLNNPQVDQLVQQIGNRRPVVWERLFFFADLAIAVLNLGVTHFHPDPFDVSSCNHLRQIMPGEHGDESQRQASEEIEHHIEVIPYRIIILRAYLLMYKFGFKGT